MIGLMNRRVLAASAAASGANEAATVANLVADLERALSQRPPDPIQGPGEPYLCLLKAAFEVFLSAVNDPNLKICTDMAIWTAGAHAEKFRTWANELERAVHGCSAPSAT